MSIPLRGCPHSRTDSPQNARNAAGIHQHAHSKETPYNAPQNAAQRTPKPQHQHAPNRTRAAIQDYTLQQPGRSSRPQGSPNGDPQTAQQRAGTPPGCNGSPTDRSRPQRRTGGTEGNRKRPEPKPGALRLIYSFLTGRREPPAEKSKCKVKSFFHPPY